MCLRWSKATSASVSISAMSGSAERIGVRLAERLDRAHEVVAEVADRAAGERRRVRAAAPGRSARPRSAASAYGSPASPSDQRSTARGPEADERPAPDALALVGRLEQERRVPGRRAA